MVEEDAKDEGLKAWKPVYPIMTAGPVASVLQGHLGAKVDKDGKVLYDLGPLEDFGRTPPPGVPAPSPSAAASSGPASAPPPPPSSKVPPAEELAREKAQQARERSSWAWVFNWLPRW